MKGLILCAGRGTRLRPHTYARPKPLLPVGNCPIILHAISKLIEGGITDIAVVVSPQSLSQFRERIGTQYRSANITYVPQPEPLGLANAVQAADKFIQGDSVCVWLGDNYYSGNLRNLVDDFNSKKADALLIVNEVEDPRQFGVAVLDGTEVTRVVEKPQKYVSPYALVGIYMFQSKIFEFISRLTPSPRGEYELTTAIQLMIESGNKVIAYTTKDWWRDTGNPSDFLLCNRYVVGNITEHKEAQGVSISNSTVDHAVVIGQNTKIVDSTITGPVVIGENCRIVGSHIGPFTSIGDETEIEDSEIENSVILEHAAISRIPARIDSSIIGGSTVLQGASKHPETLQLFLGDYSKLQLGSIEKWPTN